MDKALKVEEPLDKKTGGKREKTKGEIIQD